MAMLWMETYLLYCSVRLGVMVICFLAFTTSFVISILFFAMGLQLVQPMMKLFNDHDHFRKHFIVKSLTDIIKNHSETMLITVQIYFFANMAACALAFYGTLKIKKYYLIPLAIFEFFRVIYVLIAHILLMTVCKNRFNLGVLITATLGGGFFILYLAYNWATIVALYQIITLINSQRYKAIYGDDPFKPLIPKTYNPHVTENVRVLITPRSLDIDEQKLRNMEQQQIIAPSPRQIIPVIPTQNKLQSQANKWHWRRPEWPVQRHGGNGTTFQSNAVYPAPTQYNDSVNYNYWQWSEVASNNNKVQERNQKNSYYNSNWRY